jgi:vacuolar-type H+-ATPase subunit D/Vma8
MKIAGRAAIVATERRLAAARAGARMLDRKQRILAEELARYELEAGRAAEEWRKRAEDALRWLHRAEALDGADRLAEAGASGPAVLDVVWGATLGTARPTLAKCALPELEPSGGSWALRECAVAHRDALAAAAASAAADRAVLLLAAELASSRRRQRVLEKRRIPRLERELLEAHRDLEQQELEELLRMRWAARG